MKTAGTLVKAHKRRLRSTYQDATLHLDFFVIVRCKQVACSQNRVARREC